jgi:hypothetical protein
VLPKCSFALLDCEDPPTARPERIGVDSGEYPASENVAGETEKAQWLFSFTKQFKKDIDGMDRELQGRVLEAIGEICEAPLREFRWRSSQLNAKFPLIPSGVTNCWTPPVFHSH